MELTTILQKLAEAAKVLHLDKTHSALRDKLQAAVSAHHATSNPDASYYDHPYVNDVYGDNESGTVVYSKHGKHTMATFKSGKDGSYSLSSHKPVKRAYVSDNDADDAKESKLLFVAGNELIPVSESSGEIEEVINLREAAFDANGDGMVKLIAPGHGATGYYSKEVLQQAAKDNVFPAGTHMYLDHQTESEEAERPENSVLRLAAKTTSPASWMDDGPEGAGLYAKANAFSSHRDFLNERAKDIGVSIRALGTGIEGQVGGRVNRIVKKLVAAKSVDFVTQAGAGGKLVPLLESFRAKATEKRQPAARKGDNMEINDQELAALKESAAKVPTLTLQVSRANERLAKIDAKEVAVELLSESGLPAPAVKRVTLFLVGQDSVIPLDKDGNLDRAKFTESVKKAAENEAAYLKEAAVPVRIKGEAVPASDEDVKKFNESISAIDSEFDKLLSGLTGITKEKK